MAGNWGKVKGKVKELAGAVTGAKGVESKGKLEQAKGRVKNAGENLKEHAKGEIGRAGEKAKDVTERIEHDTESRQGA